MNTIWVIGSQNIDHIYYMKELPLQGRTVLADSYVSATGGKGANQAIAAAHFGAHVEMIGCVGDDAAGDTLLGTLRARGVGTGYVQRIAGASGSAVVYVDRAGANCITIYPGANRKISAQALPVFQKGDFLLAQMEVNTDALLAGFAAAKRTGATTILNPSPYHSDVEHLLPLADILVLNEHEAYEASGVSPENWEAAMACMVALSHRGTKEVVITLGGKGAVCRDGEQTFAIDGISARVVDTQGAGDAFLGALASRLAAGAGLREAAGFANRVGAYAVTKSGSTQVSLPESGERF